MAEISKINNGVQTYDIMDAFAARDNAVVHKTGNETIAGTKNFINDLKIGNGQGSGLEGGQINFGGGNPTLAGSAIDNHNGKFRILGQASSDGTSVTGFGTPLVIDPYAKTITGEYSFDDLRTSGRIYGNLASSVSLPSDSISIFSSSNSLSDAEFTSGVTVAQYDYWGYFGIKNAAAGSYLKVVVNISPNNSTTILAVSSSASSANQDIFCYVPIPKGRYVYLDYNVQSLSFAKFATCGSKI